MAPLSLFESRVNVLFSSTRGNDVPFLCDLASTPRHGERRRTSPVPMGSNLSLRPPHSTRCSSRHLSSPCIHMFQEKACWTSVAALRHRRPHNNQHCTLYLDLYAPDKQRAPQIGDDASLRCTRHARNIVHVASSRAGDKMGVASFCTIIASSGWNNYRRSGSFLDSLSEDLRSLSD